MTDPDTHDSADILDMECTGDCTDCRNGDDEGECQRG